MAWWQQNFIVFVCFGQMKIILQTQNRISDVKHSEINAANQQ